jgi:anti-sigma B factor antagonist
MKVTVNTVEQITVVNLEGDLDGKTAPEVQAQITPLIQGGGKMILDMVKVPYMSSAGLRVLLMLYRQAAANNGKIVLVGLSEELSDTMSVTGFLNFFTTCETLDSAIKMLNENE